MPKLIKKIKKLSRKFVAFICMITLIVSFSVITKTDAAALSSISDTLTDSRFNTVSNHTVAFTNDTIIPTSGTIAVAFEADFTTTGLVVADLDLEVGGVDLSLAADCSATEEAGAVVSGNTVTFTVCSDYNTNNGIAATSAITVKVGSNATAGSAGTMRIQNPATAVCGSGNNSYVCSITITTSASGSATAQVAILTGVTVNATVDAYMTFVYSESGADDYTVGFGSWSGGSTAIRYATSDAAGTETPTPGNEDPFRLVLTSNTANASITVKGINSNGTAGLYSSGASAEIEAIVGGAFGVTAAAEGFGVYGSSTGATMVMHDDFDNDSTDGQLLTTNKTFATGSDLGANTIEVDMKAAIASNTPAGSYTTTLVFVATPVY